MVYTRKGYTPEERAAYNAQKQAEMDESVSTRALKRYFSPTSTRNISNSLQSSPTIPHEIRFL